MGIAVPEGGIEVSAENLPYVLAAVAVAAKRLPSDFDETPDQDIIANHPFALMTEGDVKKARDILTLTWHSVVTPHLASSAMN